MKAALRKCVSGVGLLSGLLCLACCGCATRAISHDGGGESAAVVLVARGRSFARIVVPHDASETVRDAAALLSDCVFRSTGAKLEVETEPVSESEVISLHCGHTTYVKGLDLALHTLDADGFVIAFPDTRNIVIAGPAQYGTEFGVYEFLERHVGVRWLFPGELGEFLPMRQALVIPMVEMRQEPAYHSRLLGGPGWWQGFRTHEKNEKSLWARRNRMQTRMRYHHNLFRLFPPENYTKSHPEFFPIVGGKRYLPTGSKEDQSGWQPCFTEPGTTSEAIRNICAYFKAHPDEVSYSLGLNDGRGGPFSGHCECERCLKAVGTTSINFVG
ncbi:MAG: DUF4838 domain-containing protein, partial [Lentisphaeria bacterium]|nr:DUF4838 domain-containing protein [Lentisphaeria bacterium]